MKFIDAVERLAELGPVIALIWFPCLVWLSIVPLFFVVGPPGEPVGDDSCRYWKDCVEQRESVDPVVSPDKKSN